MHLGTSLTRSLPPPHYLRMPSAGVDISDTSLKYITFVPNSRTGTLAVERFGDLSLPEGTLARGEVQNIDNLVEALKVVKQESTTEYVRCSLPEERAYLFETRIKKDTPFNQVRGLLEFRLEENVPLSPRDAYFDYEIYPLADAADELGVSVTAYACDTINGYYEACQRASVIPLSFEVEAHAITRAVLPSSTKGTHLIVDFGKTRTGVGIVHNGVLMYTSTIDVGGDKLSSALRKQFGEKDEAELTKLKNTEGLTKDTDSHSALIATVSVIRDELVKRIEYWNGRDIGNEDRFIANVILCGGASNLKGLPEYLSHSLNIPTVRANVWQNAFAVQHTVPPIDQQHAYGYATAIGLALTNLI